MDDERASAVAPSDEEILAALAERPDDFALLYRRHVRGLLGYLLRRTGDAELAADLCAETFAAALAGARRFDPARGPAVAWLYGIARRLLHRAQRRGAVEDTARRRLGMAPVALSDAALERIERTAGSEVAIAEALAALPEDQRAAVTERVLDERGYDEIAARARTSQSVIRKRVSRGLAGMRARRVRRRDPGRRRSERHVRGSPRVRRPLGAPAGRADDGLRDRRRGRDGHDAARRNPQGGPRGGDPRPRQRARRGRAVRRRRPAVPRARPRPVADRGQVADGVTPQQPTVVWWRERAQVDEATEAAALLAADDVREVDQTAPGPVFDAGGDVVAQVGAAGR